MGIDDMNAEKPKRIRRDWPAIFDKFHQSGQTATAFCRAEGIPQSLFYKRRKEHTGNHQSIRSSLVRSDFIELKSMSASRWSAAIAFDNQVELSIANDCDHELLRQLITQLRD